MNGPFITLNVSYGSFIAMEAVGGRAVWPTVGVVGFLDEAAQGDERGGWVEVEVDGCAVAVGAAAGLP
jgi:hypothetical protein